eukprot:3849653-Rhodomonas_salina.1
MGTLGQIPTGPHTGGSQRVTVYDIALADSEAEEQELRTWVNVPVTSTVTDHGASRDTQLEGIIPSRASLRLTESRARRPSLVHPGPLASSDRPISPGIRALMGSCKAVYCIALCPSTPTISWYCSVRLRLCHLPVGHSETEPRRAIMIVELMFRVILRTKEADWSYLRIRGFVHY